MCFVHSGLSCICNYLTKFLKSIIVQLWLGYGYLVNILYISWVFLFACWGRFGFFKSFLFCTSLAKESHSWKFVRQPLQQWTHFGAACFGILYSSVRYLPVHLMYHGFLTHIHLCVYCMLGICYIRVTIWFYYWLYFNSDLQHVSNFKDIINDFVISQYQCKVIQRFWIFQLNVKSLVFYILFFRVPELFFLIY